MSKVTIKIRILNQFLAPLLHAKDRARIEILEILEILETLDRQVFVSKCM